MDPADDKKGKHVDLHREGLLAGEIIQSGVVQAGNLYPFGLILAYKKDTVLSHQAVGKYFSSRLYLGLFMPIH